MLLKPRQITNNMGRFIMPLMNEGKSAASFYHQEAAQALDMFCYFYLVINHKIANNSVSTEAREKISTYLESSEF
jgi:hypothetical protein